MESQTACMQILGGLSGTFWSMLKLLDELSELVLVLPSCILTFVGNKAEVSIKIVFFTKKCCIRL